MLDVLPAWARHLIFAVVPILLGWAASDLVPLLQDRSPVVAGLVGALVTILTAALTPLTRQYGVGSAPSTEQDPTLP